MAKDVIWLVEENKNGDCIKKYAISIGSDNKASVVELIKGNDGMWNMEHHYTKIACMSSRLMISGAPDDNHPTIMEAVTFIVSAIALIAAFIK